MKKFLILILTITTLSSCSKDDDNSTNQIVGEWKLIKAQFYGFGGQESIDYLDEEIIYYFQSNGILIVDGGQNAGYPNGEYEYSFGEDYISGAPTENETKILLVKINNSKWTYNMINGEMKLGQSYVDGPDLIFIKK